MIHFRPNYSFHVLVQLFGFSLFVLLMMLLNYNFLFSVYFENQLTNTGLVINGGIIFIFFIGLVKTVFTLLFYWNEEKSLDKFIINMRQAQQNLVPNISNTSLIMHRYKTMLDIHRQKASINQGALAAAMVAHESTRLSLPRFISNILILCGVFGTIISLSVALLGASNLLNAANDLSGMGGVIHGMSTALSTTTTAIVCYLFFGYFFQKLTDVQTHLFSAIEQVSTQFLMPKFSHQNDDVLYHLSELVGTLNQTAVSMHTSQQYFLQASQKADEMVSQYDKRVETMAADIHQIKQILRQGFRLPESPEDLSDSEDNGSKSTGNSSEHLPSSGIRTEKRN